MGEKGDLIVVSGPSGAGKSTVLGELLKLRDNLRFSVSATTRPPREGERDGVDYYFVTPEQFRRMVDEDSFLEYAEYVGNSYGTPRAAVEARRAEGLDVFLDIEVQGAAQVRQKCPEALFVFLMPPSLAELERRLVSRGKDAPEVIRERLAEAEREIACRDRYGHVVVNDTPERAAAELSALIDAHKRRGADAE